MTSGFNIHIVDTHKNMSVILIYLCSASMRQLTPHLAHPPQKVTDPPPIEYSMEY